jgi:hypothetical protein
MEGNHFGSLWYPIRKAIRVIKDEINHKLRSASQRDEYSPKT